jgi:hypothetical protein
MFFLRMRNKPNLPAVGIPHHSSVPSFQHSSVPTRCRLCETNPIARRKACQDHGRRQSCQTKPVWKGIGRERPTHSLSLRAGSTKSRLVQNEAKGRQPVVSWRTDRAKRTQLGGTERTHQGCGCCCHRGRICQTNPIGATARKRASALWERSYDQSDLQRAREKQSQSAQEFQV